MNASDPILTILNMVIGIIMLTAGRKLFWLFVGCIGFAVGFHYAPILWNIHSHVILLGLAILMGIIGAMLAVFLQKIAVGLVGFAAGGYIASSLFNLLGFRLDQFDWLPLLMGGIAGTLLLILIFDWALIFVSSLAGASLMIDAMRLSPRTAFAVYCVLVTVGVIVQAVLFLKSRPGRKKGT